MQKQKVKLQIGNMYNARYRDSRGERNSGKSETIPDETMTVREMLQRAARGMPIKGNPLQPVYHGDNIFIPDVKTMDLSELHAYRKKAKEDYEEKKAVLEGELKKRKDAIEATRVAKEKQLEIDKAVEAALKAERAAKS